MSKLIILIGISNSGKSTFAHEEWTSNSLRTVVVNRDKIRELLFSYTEETVREYYSRPDLNKLEKQVTKYEDTLIHEALNENKTVILDATHLRKEYLDRFKFWNVPIELKWFDVTLKEALTRNMSRKRQVDPKIIEKQYSQYLSIRNLEWKYEPTAIQLNESLPPCILLDIDGTIAHMNGKRSPFDWKNVGLDDVCKSLLPVIKALSSEHYRDTSNPEIIVVSGRDSVCRDETIGWLFKNKINFEILLMRAEKDVRPDWQIKEEIWTDLATEYNILGLFDDRLQVVRRARALGLKVFNVAYNNF